MPSNLKRQELLTFVRNRVASELREHGELIIGPTTDAICAEQRKLISDLGEELARASVSRMVRGQVGSWATIALIGAGQLSLFGIPDDILSEMPPTITVPDESGDVKHVALSRATTGQLRAYERMLGKQIKDDQRKHRAVRYVVSKCASLGDDVALVDAFAPVTA